MRLRPPAVADEKERQVFLESALSDSLAIYLLSLVLDLDYSELRERDYPLLAPGALAERLKLVSETIPRRTRDTSLPCGTAAGRNTQVFLSITAQI